MDVSPAKPPHVAGSKFLQGPWVRRKAAPLWRVGRVRRTVRQRCLGFSAPVAMLPGPKRPDEDATHDPARALPADIGTGARSLDVRLDAESRGHLSAAGDGRTRRKIRTRRGRRRAPSGPCGLSGESRALGCRTGTRHRYRGSPWRAGTVAHGDRDRRELLGRAAVGTQVFDAARRDRHGLALRGAPVPARARRCGRHRADRRLSRRHQRRQPPRQPAGRLGYSGQGHGRRQVGERRLGIAPGPHCRGRGRRQKRPRRALLFGHEGPPGVHAHLCRYARHRALARRQPLHRLPARGPVGQLCSARGRRHRRAVQTWAPGRDPGGRQLPRGPSQGRRLALSFERLFHPNGIVVIGASSDLTRISGQPIKALKNAGYPGPIYLVNPKYKELHGLPCFPDAMSLPGPCDLAVVAVPAPGVAQAIRDCGKAKIPFAVVLTAGFRETGAEGRKLEAELRAALAGSGVRMVGPNCQGMLSVQARVWAAFGSVSDETELRPGKVSCAFQSGGFGYAVVNLAEAQGIGFRYCVSSGNEVDITTPELLSAFLDDSGTALTFAYMEGTPDARRLLDLGRKSLETGKPVLMWKAGTT